VRRLFRALAAIIALGCIGLALPAQARGPQPFAPRAAYAERGGDALAEAARWIGSGKMTGLPGPWCADFVSFVLRRTGHAPLANRLAASALDYGPRLSGPKVGALAVIRTRRGWAGHVGLVEGIEPDGSIRLISGNWGRRVARSVVPRASVVAFVAVR
jgi:uncharacterized protein (TIGR02594 family)